MVNQIIRVIFLVIRAAMLIVIIALTCQYIRELSAFYTINSKEQHAPANIDGYWFELDRATSNTIAYGASTKILQILPKPKNQYEVKFSLDEDEVFTGLFKWYGTSLKGDANCIFGPIKKNILFYSANFLMFEHTMYVRIGRKAITTDLRPLNKKFLQVIIDRDSASPSDTIQKVK